jgi:hypothetical protein
LQLASRRTASIARNAAGALTVSVTGRSSPNAFGLATSATPAAGHLVTATIDVRNSVGDGDLDWTPAQFPAGGGDMKATLTMQTGSTVLSTTWSGSIAGAPTTAGGKEYRVRVEEFEQFEADPGFPTGLRPVYLDTFRLSI